MEMPVKHLCLVHHKGFKRSPAHLQDDYGSRGEYIIFAMMTMCFLSKQSFILHWWRETKKTTRRNKVSVYKHMFSLQSYFTEYQPSFYKDIIWVWQVG